MRLPRPSSRPAGSRKAQNRSYAPLPQAIASVSVAFTPLFAKRVFAHVKLLLVGVLLALGGLGLVQGSQYTLELSPGLPPFVVVSPNTP